MPVDSFSVVNVGMTRTTPPGPGAEPQRDTLLRVHLGWFVFREDTGDKPVDDEIFCIMTSDDQVHRVVLEDDEVFCVVLEDEQETRIK